MLESSQAFGGGGGENPLLSIVVPVYNVEKYLRQCLDSLVHQTLKNIEIIVVNDCSPDNSEAIILEYVEKDNRIVYIKHDKNKGLGGARNTGIQVAQGEYIAFVDSDDYVDTALYAAAVRAFTMHQVDVVSIPFCNFDESGFVKSFYRSYKKVHRVGLTQALDYTFYAAWSKVYRRSDIQQNAFIFPENIYWEDIPFWLEYCAVMYPKVWNLHRRHGFYHYRQRKESISGQRSQNYWQLPHMFLFLYQRFVQRDLIEPYFASLYEIIVEQCVYASNVLHGEYRIQFIQAFIDFVKEIRFSASIYHLASVWQVLTVLDDFMIQKSVFELYLQKSALERKLKIDLWYNFSQLPFPQKFPFLLHCVLKRLSQVFTFKK